MSGIPIAKALKFLENMKLPGYKIFQFKEEKKFLTYNQFLLSSSFDVVGTLEGACTDGHKIFLQSSINEFSNEIFNDRSQNKNFNMLFGFFCHEAAHILEGSFDVNWKSILTEEYKEGRGLAKELFNIMEDYRIEKNMVNVVFCGDEIKPYFDQMNTYYNVKFSYQNTDKDGQNFLEMFLREVKSKRKGKLFQEHPEYFEKYFTGAALNKDKLEELTKKLYEKDKKDAGGEDSKQKAMMEQFLTFGTIDELVSWEDSFLAKPTKFVHEDGYATYGALLEHVVSRVKTLGGKTVVDTMNELRGVYDLILKEFKEDLKGDGKGDKNGSKTFRPCDNMGSDDNSEKTEKTDFDEMETGDFEPGSSKEMNDKRKEIEKRISDKAGKINKDYDKRNQQCKPENDDPEVKRSQVYIYTPEGPGGIVDIEHRELKGETPYIHPNQVLANQIRRDFLLLKPNVRQVVRRTAKPGPFNPLKLYMSQVDPLSTLDGKLYDSVHTNKLDIGIYFLIDASGSTSDHMEDGTMKLDLAKECAAIMWDGVNGIGGLQGIRGAHTKTYFFESSKDTTYIYEAKNPRTFNGIGPGNGNNDGSAVRYTLEEIKRDNHKTNLLFILSDGYPVQACGEEPALDLSQAIRECEVAGVRTNYLLIRPGGANGRKEGDRQTYDLIVKHASSANEVSKSSNLPYIVRKIVKRLALR